MVLPQPELKIVSADLVLHCFRFGYRQPWRLERCGVLAGPRIIEALPVLTIPAQRTA